MLLEPMLIEDDKIIKSGKFRTRFTFNRMQNDVVKSKQVLSVNLQIKDEEFVAASVWLPGETMVNNDVLDVLWSNLWELVFKKINRDNDVIVRNTVVKNFNELIGWQEDWTFLDLISKEEFVFTLNFKFTKEGGIAYEIQSTFEL